MPGKMMRLTLDIDADQVDEINAMLAMLSQQFQAAVDQSKSETETPEAASAPVGGAKPPQKGNDVDAMMAEALGMGPQ